MKPLTSMRRALAKNRFAKGQRDARRLMRNGIVGNDRWRASSVDVDDADDLDIDEDEAADDNEVEIARFSKGHRAEKLPNGQISIRRTRAMTK